MGEGGCSLCMRCCCHERFRDGGLGSLIRDESSPKNCRKGISDQAERNDCALTPRNIPWHRK